MRKWSKSPGRGMQGKRSWSSRGRRRYVSVSITLTFHTCLLMLTSMEAFELEFLNGDSAGQTDTVSMFRLPPSPNLAEYLATGTNPPSRSHQETSEVEITVGFSPSQSRKTPLGRQYYSDLDEGETHPASRILPRNMLVFKGTESANMSDIWTVCCARKECRTNMTSHGEILKGTKGVCLHARACHYATWKPIFEGKSDQIKLFGENPDWCEWYHLTEAEVEDWRLSGQLPKQVVPRAAATVFEKSKPPTQKLCIDEAY